MAHNRTLELLEDGVEGYAYYCGLCNEIFALSRRLIEPRKIRLVFDERCPGCGFELERVLRCEASRIPPGIDLFTNPECRNADHLVDPPSGFDPNLNRGSALPRDPQPSLTTGIETLDRNLVLKFGQLAVLQGEPSNPLSHLLSVRAVLPQPSGPDSDVVFIDGGNLFDAYSISAHSIEHELDSEKVLARIHLSRAFTHHQLTSLITEKLPSAIDRFNAKLAVVSDIMQLYCDPDIQRQSKREAIDLFARTARFLAGLAERKHALIVATNLQSRDAHMDKILLHTAHVYAKLEDRGAFTQVTVARHPWIPQHKATVRASLDNATLERYL